MPTKIISDLQKERLLYEPKMPNVLKGDLSRLGLKKINKNVHNSQQDVINKLFPNTSNLPYVVFEQGENEPDPSCSQKVNIGVVLSGGQAPGGHNVISGMFDAIKEFNSGSNLIGFLGGPYGLLTGESREITKDMIDSYRNTGGFDMIGSGRTKIDTDEQFAMVQKVLEDKEIKGLVIVGGDDSNTNAGILAEYLKSKGSDISVVGVPKTIDGDLKGENIPVSFGFDTATKVYADLVGNIQRDALSARKYWHFIKLMGRSASHVTLEVALQTRPNLVLISEEVEKKNMTLSQVVDIILDTVTRRFEKGYDFGVALIPEGIIEFIPEVKKLISDINEILVENNEKFHHFHNKDEKIDFINDNLSISSSLLYQSLPNDIKDELILDRDPHGNVQVSKIETEKLLIELLRKRLNFLKSSGEYKGKFSFQTHFLGYEGRSGFPSNFDANYCYSLGKVAFMLIQNSCTGYIASVYGKSSDISTWQCGGVPINSMITIERRHGKEKPVIKKALVDLEGKPFAALVEHREKWAFENQYHFPGAIQYFGPEELTDRIPKSLALES